jgi:hypothetical protein
LVKSGSPSRASSFWNIANGERFNGPSPIAALALARSAHWQEPRSALAHCPGFFFWNITGAIGWPISRDRISSPHTWLGSASPHIPRARRRAA